jgi:hypothetical protein
MALPLRSKPSVVSLNSRLTPAQTNPTHGQKVTSSNDIKAEHAGPIPKDSLAADSLRSGGSFAEGPNPAGISGATGSGGTFGVVPTAGAKVESHTGKKPETPLGKPDAATKHKAGQVGTTGGGKQTQEAFSAGGIGPHGKRTATSFEHDAAKGSEHSGGSMQQRSAAGSAGLKHGGGEAPLNTGTNSMAFAGSSGGKNEGKVGDSAKNVDWSRIPKDTRTTTDIGSKDDPGRLAEINMHKKTMTHGGDNTGKEDNPYGPLDDENL